jgi:hypothetical protein
MQGTPICGDSLREDTIDIRKIVELKFDVWITCEGFKVTLIQRGHHNMDVGKHFNLGRTT